MKAQEIAQQVQEAQQAWEAPGVAVAVVQGDEVVYCQGVGVKERGKEEPVTADSLFAIASTTKAFTCTAIAMLAEEGKLSWDDPVRKHLDYFRLSEPLADAHVTLRDLVTHRTGVSRHDLLWYNSSLTREEIIRRIALLPANTSFRSNYEYNNIMYLTAGVALGQAAGSSWEEVLRERIFQPLGMTGANFSVRDAVLAPDHVTPHWKDPEGSIRTVPWCNLDSCAPGGAINAGVRDLSKWLRFQIAEGEFEGKRLLSREKLLETRSPQMVTSKGPVDREATPYLNFSCYGLGWGIFDHHGHQVIAHGGGIDGFRSQVALVPEAKLGIAILSNLTPSLLPEALRNRLIEGFLDLPPCDWNQFFLNQQEKHQAEEKTKKQERDAKRHPDAKPSRELAAYVGGYNHPAYGTAHVALENGALILQWSGYHLALAPFHFDTFLATATGYPPVEELVPFALDVRGEPVRLTLFGQDFRKDPPCQPTARG